MTDTKISQLSALLQGMQDLSQTAEKSQKTEAAFGALLSQTAEKGYEHQYSWTQDIGRNNVSAASNQTAYEKEAAKTSYKDTSFVKESSTDISSKLPGDAKEQLETVTTEVKEALQEKLGVSEEELVQVMEELGLTVLDLANPAKMIQLAMELTGSQDGSELLLNPDFQALMTQVEELFGQVTEGLNLTPEEFMQLTEQLAEIQQNVPAETESTEQAEGLEQLEQGKVSQKMPETEVQENTVLTEKKEAEEAVVLDSSKQLEEGSTEEADEPVLMKQTEALTEEQTGEESQEETGKQKTPVLEHSLKSETGTKEGQQPQISFQTTTQTINNGQTVEVVQTVVQSQIDVESVLRQISQMTRISVTQAQSSIEMQLNPENLGKVYLQVISKEGAITAQIAAQNEAVKEVLESQIAVLKENMNQQGMKVEAIEVTVASHEFEQNLEEHQDNPAKEQKEPEKTSRRGINLNRLDELEGIMSEEETLAAKIMQENGNSVDLTA